MSSKKSEIKEEASSLLFEGNCILVIEAINEKEVKNESVKEFCEKESFIEFKKRYVSNNLAYQVWYTKVCRLITLILPERIEEFKLLYDNPKRKNIDYLTYTISDYQKKLVIRKMGEPLFNTYKSFENKLMIQLNILKSCLEILDTKLANIEGVLQSELFEDELETAKDLLKKKHIRLAGALAGITMEVHLKKVCSNHAITLRKANPTISDCNEALKNAETIDLVTWRLIQRLGDIRNLSVHAKDREPTESEVQDLIIGCEKLIAELF